MMIITSFTGSFMVVAAVALYVVATLRYAIRPAYDEWWTGETTLRELVNHFLGFTTFFAMMCAAFFSVTYAAYKF